MIEKLESILMGSMQVLLKEGVKKTTMADVAKHLKISKKTLYKFVTDKNDLILKMMQLVKIEDERIINGILEEGLNAIDENFEIYKTVIQKLENIHPAVFSDMEKYHPDAWTYFEEYQNDFVFNCLINNLKRGISEGLYRKDINVEIIAKLYVHRINDIFNPNVFSPDKYLHAEIYIELFKYHVMGIASEKGIKYLQTKGKEEQLKF